MQAFLAILWGCAGPGTDSPDGCTTVFYADDDRDGHGDPGAPASACEAPDGYTAVPDDCDDANVAVHPDASEICNAIDDDCDGTVDVDAVDAPIWYADRDEDGFGDDAATAVRCAMPLGHVDAGGDCDDADAAVHPSGIELCNAIDDDCDGLVDALDPTLDDGVTWYVDADEDHYGDPTNAMVACTHPEGTVEDATDCDDTSADARPGGDEACDGLDNDCDGLTDDEDDPPILGTTLFFPDADGDGLGAPPAVAWCVAPTGYVDTNDDCDDTDASIGEAIDLYTDFDLDGYGTGTARPSCPAANKADNGDDCDDRRDTVFPGAPELCNNADDNCNGLVDGEDALVVYDTWYGDGDGDGYGDPTDTDLSCHAPDGYVANSADCDDADAAVNPTALEWCDAIDNDCTGTVDDAVVYIDWYADTDADGYGDAADVKNDCVEPSGYVSVDGDCDDGTALVSPDADDVCANDVDDDCDGALDNCRVTTADAYATIGGAAAKSDLGETLAVADMDADGTADLVIGNPYREDYVGGVFVVRGPVSGAVDVADAIAITASGSAEGYLGLGLLAADVDLDGFDDLVALAPGSVPSPGGLPPAVWTYAFLGPVTGDLATRDADITWLLPSSNLQNNSTATSLGDFDGDDAPDVAIGATDDGTGGGGTVSVVPATSTGTVDLHADATYVYEGHSSSDIVGRSIAALGDVNGDGIDDMAIGANYGVSYNGEVYVILGGDASGSYQVDRAASATVTGAMPADYLGDELVAADYDQDGAVDLFAAAGGVTSSAGVYSGAVYAFLGPLSGAVATTDAAARWESPDNEDSLGDGHGLAVGDVDGDKSPDVLIGSGSSPGDVYLQLGPASGVVDVSSLLWISSSETAELGNSIGIVPDWTGDDEAEIAVGAPSVPDAAGDQVGAVYVFSSEGIY